MLHNTPTWPDLAQTPSLVRQGTGISHCIACQYSTSQLSFSTLPEGAGSFCPPKSLLSAAQYMALENPRPQTGKTQFWRTGTLPPRIFRPHQPHDIVHRLNLGAPQSTQAHNGPRKERHALVACHHSGHNSKGASRAQPCRLPSHALRTASMKMLRWDRQQPHTRRALLCTSVGNPCEVKSQAHSLLTVLRTHSG